jgi:hypothetical protein
LPGGVGEALAEDVLEIEAEEEVPEVREFVERAVTPEEPVELADDAELVVEDVVVADVEAEELTVLLIEEVDSLSSSPPSIDAELEEPEADEVPELLAETLAPTLMLKEDEAVAVLAAGLLTELNLPSNRFKCVSLSSVTTSLPTDFLK